MDPLSSSRMALSTRVTFVVTRRRVPQPTVTGISTVSATPGEFCTYVMELSATLKLPCPEIAVELCCGTLQAPPHVRPPGNRSDELMNTVPVPPRQNLKHVHPVSAANAASHVRSHCGGLVA